MRKPQRGRSKRKAPPRVSWSNLHHSKTRGVVSGIARHYGSTAATFRKTAERLSGESNDHAQADDSAA